MSLFPLVEDFVVLPVFGEITAWHTRQPHLVGAQFHSSSVGYLAGHQWWEQIFYINKLEHNFSSQNVPKGTAENPHWDFQPGWHIVIFEHEDCIYILQADDDQSDEFSIGFRVRSEDYSRAWLEALKHYETNS